MFTKLENAKQNKVKSIYNKIISTPTISAIPRKSC